MVASSESTADPRIAGLIYLQTVDGLLAGVVEGGCCEWIRLKERASLLLDVGGLRRQLTDTVRVARGRLEKLDEFAGGWGRDLIPSRLLSDPPDVLVIIPQGVLHVLPLHLVQTDIGSPLACLSGVTYCSSLSLFCRCAARNTSRLSSAGQRMGAGGGADVVGAADVQFRGLAAKILQRFAASPATRFVRTGVRHALRGRYNVVCLVAHGYIDEDNYRSSGLILERDHVFIGRRVFNIPGPLGGYDHHYWVDLPGSDLPEMLQGRHGSDLFTIDDLELGAPADVELAILAACSAGTSQILQADEPASIAEALLRQGCDSVIAPMWDCDYALADPWIEKFMEAWLDQRRPKALAAREAYRALESGTGPVSLGPLHLRGDWR